jgi:non-specific serine/threonine protein kinase
MHHFQGDQALVSGYGAEVATLGTLAGDAWAMTAGLFLQSLAAFELGDVDRACAHAVAARASADACGDLVEHGGPLMILANVALVRGQHDEALRFYEASIDVHRRVQDIWGLSILLSITAGLRLVRGDLHGAQLGGAEALSLCRALGDPRGIAWSLEVFAGVLAATGRPADAARLWGLSDTLVETSGGALTATIGWIRDRYGATVRTALGESSFLDAAAQGRRLSVDDAVALFPAGATLDTPDV